MNAFWKVLSLLLAATALAEGTWAVCEAQKRPRGGTIVCKSNGYADLANITLSGTLVSEDVWKLADRISHAICEETRI